MPFEKDLETAASKVQTSPQPSSKQLGALEAIANRVEWALTGRGSGPPKLPSDGQGEEHTAQGVKQTLR